MTRAAAVVLTVLAVTGVASGKQDPPTTFELAGSSGTPIRFTLHTESRNIALQADSLYTRDTSSIEARTPAAIRFPPSEPFDVVLTTATPADTLQMAVTTRDCVAVRFSSFNVTNQGLPDQVSYMQDAEISCSGGTLMFSGKQILTSWNDGPSAPRIVLNGQRITVGRSNAGGPIRVQAQSLTVGTISR